jgi:hypothetical protein
MMTVAADHDFVSIGHLAQDTQHSPRAIERACEKLGIMPAMRINRVPHFDAAQAEKITAYFREQSK